MNMKAVKRWLPLILIVVLIGAAWASGLLEMVNLEMIKQQRETLLGLVAAHPVLSVITFIVLYAAVVALSLPIAVLMTLTGGLLFGKWLGTVIIVLGATVGATLVFLIE